MAQQYSTIAHLATDKTCQQRHPPAVLSCLFDQKLHCNTCILDLGQQCSDATVSELTLQSANRAMRASSYTGKGFKKAGTEKDCTYIAAVLCVEKAVHFRKLAPIQCCTC